MNILRGVNTHPGSGTLEQHAGEIELFNGVLDHVDDPRPVMIELGSFWAIWSLMFRMRFPQGRNLLVELGRRQLYVGLKNFQLNGYSCDWIHGGFHLGASGTFANRAMDLEYAHGGEGVDIDGMIRNDPDFQFMLKMPLTGGELVFDECVPVEEWPKVDVMHMDIQSSELPLLEEIRPRLEGGVFRNLVVATHSQSIHESIRKLLDDCGMRKVRDEPGVGGDGWIHAIPKLKQGD